MAKVEKDLGAVSAYAYAVEQGYTGTEEEYAELMASYAGVAEQAAASASAAAISAGQAAQSATNAAGSAQTAETVVSGAISSIEAKGTEQIGLVSAEGTTQVGLVTAEGATQAEAVEAKGDEVMASIPQDYSALSSDVTQLKSDFIQLESAYIAIEQGYWNASDGIGGVSANWVRTKGFLPSGIIIKSKIRMLLQAWTVAGVYVGTWDGTTFGNTAATSGYLYDININNWMKNYPAYLFKITWGKSPTDPTEVYAGLSIVFATDDINTLKNAIGIDVLPFYSDGTVAHSSTVNQIVKTISSGDSFYFVFHSDIAIQNNVQLIAFYTDNTNEIIQQNLVQDVVYGFIAPKEINRIGVHTTVQSTGYTFFQVIGDASSILSTYQNSLIVKNGKAYYDRVSLQKNSDKTFVFFSDVHAGSLNVQRIITYANKLAPDAVLNGGDTVSDLITDGLSWYNTLVDTCDVDILNCVGNHDMWTAHNVMDTPQNVYNAVIAPVASKVSNLVQPTGAASNGLCYYYKDYGSVRIIVLSALISPNQNYLWDAEQLAWLQSVLTDARTNSKSVICVNHAPYLKANAVIDTDLPLNSWADYKTFGFDDLHLTDEAVEAVDSFKQAGGEFICWLTGHTHADFIMHNDLYDGQLMINIATAKNVLHFDGAVATRVDAILYDCFDYLGIDLTHKMLKVLRIGYNEDASMRIRNRFAYDYGNHKLLSYS